MRFIKIKTRAFLPPKDNIYQLIDEYFPKLKERDVVFITSKILAIHQGRCIKISENVDRQKLVMSEADYFIPNHRLTIKENTIIGSAGIDQSNGDGYYILWPKNICQELKKIWVYLKKKNHIKNLGIIATDTRPNPLRYGATGISIGAFGLEPLIDYRGKCDIFNYQLKFTRVNVLDSLAPMATLLMGESNEKIPFFILRDSNFIKFTDKPTYKQSLVTKEPDTFTPLLKAFKKVR